ncbi:MAG TPA: RNA methyltransferase [Terracidiphilus sp.]|nr:RNA methyltransferase [Terracidiphilus sp.]
MPIRIVQSKQNARLKELRRAIAQPGREARGLAGIEGPNLLDEALRAGLRITAVFLAQEAKDPLKGLELPPDLDVLMVPQAILNPALATETPQPVAALVEVPDWTWAHVLRGRSAWPPLVLVLAGLQDPGNAGTIVRSAEAFGATGVVALPGTVSLWNPKAVRASAGSVFRVPQLTVTVQECFATLREAGARFLCTTGRAAEPCDMVAMTGPVALIIGNEGNGVPERIAARADECVTICCPGPVESLNAAVAASILLYEASRQRTEETGSASSLRGSTR